ncbi:MAG: cell division protein ZapA [Saccharofermentanales bacterium]
MFEYEKKVKRISVSIGGTTYHLVSDENDEYTREIARKADDAIKQILMQNTTLSNYQATVLALVNTTDALSRLSPAIAEAKNDMENANLRAKKAQDELFLVRDAEFELRKELLRINELNKQLELEIAVLRKQQSIHPFDAQKFDLENEPESMEEQIEDETDDIESADEPGTEDDAYGEYRQSSLEELFS